MRLKILTTSFLIASAIGAFEAAAGARAYAEDVSFVSSAGSVEFRAIGHPSALHVVGKGVGPQGTLVVDGEQVSGSLSFALTTLDTGISMRTEHMKIEYLEVGKFPQAQLRITHLQLPGPLTASFAGASGLPFQGILKLHGVERPVSGTVDLKSNGPNQLWTTANFSLKLTDFGITIPKFMGITIADDVQVNVEAAPQVH